MQFVVQAVNGVGLVSLDDNQGSYYQPNQIPSALQTGTASASSATSTPGGFAVVLRVRTAHLPR